MTVELINVAYGCVLAAESIVSASYETWFGKHSAPIKKAGEITGRESLELLKRLKAAP